MSVSRPEHTMPRRPRWIQANPMESVPKLHRQWPTEYWHVLQVRADHTFPQTTRGRFYQVQHPIAERLREGTISIQLRLSFPSATPCFCADRAVEKRLKCDSRYRGEQRWGPQEVRKPYLKLPRQNGWGMWAVSLCGSDLPVSQRDLGSLHKPPILPRFRRLALQACTRARLARHERRNMQ